MTLKKGSKGKNAIHLQIDKKMPLEAYSLVVDDKGVTIKGSEAGIFYGIQTLLQCVFSLMRRSTPGKGAGVLDHLVQTPCTRTKPDSLCSIRIM